MKNFYISLTALLLIIAGITYYQQYVEERSQIIIENADKNIEKEWKRLKNILFAFNDHERVEEIDNEYIGYKNASDGDIKKLHLIYFKKKLEDLIEASKIKIVNIL